MQYYRAVADCLAQCAAVFGGGAAAFGHYPLVDLLRWTHRAVQATRGEDE